jgi:Ca2+-dependent lipid-binding protein
MGMLRIDVELTLDYPFLRNASVAFVRPPAFDVTIEIGGQGYNSIDVSAIPGVHRFINNTFAWMLSQYTYPRSSSIDLRKIICPSCGVEFSARRHSFTSNLSFDHFMGAIQNYILCSMSFHI